jgi:TolB-like protein/Tfp pilus assembly protein PilF
MDFGTGQKLDDAGSTLAGTPLYLAPELFAGGEPSRASDVYSIGVVLYRLLTGSYPVSAKDVEDLRAALRRGERKPVRDALRGAPERLARVIDRALESDPARRYSNASELAADLSRSMPTTRGAPRRRFAVAAAVLLAVASWWLMSNRGDDGGGGGSKGERPTAPVAVAGVAANESHRPTLVVLPFDDSSEQPGSRHLVDGLTDEILRDLARVEGLAVRSRYSSFSFREQPRDLQAIGRRLQASYAVTGSVARSDDHLRIQVQLVDLARDRPLWADRFDRKLESTGDLFAVVDEIARGIVNQLRLTLGAGQRRYDVDLDLYERYVEARDLVERRGLTDPLQAIEMLEVILEEDPTFAPAHAALADAYAYQSIPTYTSRGLPPAESLEVMRAAATRAIELDPMLAEAHAAMGVVHARDRNWSKAEGSFERALALDPLLTHVYTSYTFTVLRPLRKNEKALRLLEQALINDPLSLSVEEEIATIDFVSGRYAEAIERFERIRAIDPDLPFVTQLLARAMIFDGRVEEGLALLDVDMAGGRGNPHYRSHGLIRLGRREEVERLAAEAAAKNRPYHELVMYAALGDLDRAFDALERTAATESHRLPVALTYPELQALDGDPRMAAFRQRFELP